MLYNYTSSNGRANTKKRQVFASNHAESNYEKGEHDMFKTYLNTLKKSIRYTAIALVILLGVFSAQALDKSCSLCYTIHAS